MELNQEIGEVTQILAKWNDAKEESLDEVFPRVYENLKRLAKNARKKIGRTNPDETLSTTVLVNEMYFKLRKSSTLSFGSSSQFYALCRVSMQNLLHDYYFRKSAKKHEIPFADDSEAAIENLIDLSRIRGSVDPSHNSLDLAIAFDQALTKLAINHPMKVEMVILKYWLDETDREIAAHFNIGETSVRRILIKSMAFIRHEIDINMKRILAEAAELTQTTVRNDYLQEKAGKNTGFLKQLVISLKEQQKN